MRGARDTSGSRSTVDVAPLPPTARRAIENLRTCCADRGVALYVVGGAVRDLLLGHAPVDIDLASDASAETMRDIARQVGVNAVYSTNDKFETVGMACGEVRLEVTRFRGPIHHHAPAAALAADLARRDFTVNAMAFVPPPLGTGWAELTDPFGGLTDLRQRTLRGVGDPLSRLREDPLRALRAVRLASEFELTIEPATRAAIRAVAPALGTVSVERIGAELGRLLVSPDPVAGLRALVDVELLPVVLPELLPLVSFRAAGSKDLWTHTLMVVAGTPRESVARWSALVHDAAKPTTYRVAGGETRFFGHELLGAKLARSILSRLRLDGQTVEAVFRVVEAHARPAHYDGTWTDGAVRRLMLDLGAALPSLLALARADVTSARAHVRERARQRIAGLEAHIERLRAQENLARLVSPLDGNDLIALFGQPPGPWIKPIKERLRDLVIDGRLNPEDKAAATALVATWRAAGDIVGVPS